MQIKQTTTLDQEASGLAWIDYDAVPIMGPISSAEIEDAALQLVKNAVKDAHLAPVEERFYNKLKTLIPSMEEIRFAGTADEAKIAAARLAQAYTKRSKILVATNLPLSAMTSGFAAMPEVNVIPAEKESILCQAIAQSTERIAAIMVEPRFDGEPTFKRYLRKARELASAEGAVLIWDETAAGSHALNLSFQMHYQIRGDITCLALENEFESAWVGGRAAIMKVGDDTLRISHRQNLISQIGLKILEMLERPGITLLLQQRAQQLASGIAQALDRVGFKTRIKSMRGQLVPFDSVPTTGERGSAFLDYDRFRTAMHKRAIVVPQSMREPWCVSLAHSENDIEATIRAAAEAIQESWVEG